MDPFIRRVNGISPTEKRKKSRRKYRIWNVPNSPQVSHSLINFHLNQMLTPSVFWIFCCRTMNALARAFNSWNLIQQTPKKTNKRDMCLKSNFWNKSVDHICARTVTLEFFQKRKKMLLLMKHSNFIGLCFRTRKSGF